MLGLRIRGGLDIARLGNAIAETTWRELEHDGLITIEHHHAIPTLRGRLLNDTIIAKLLESLD